MKEIDILYVGLPLEDMAMAGYADNRGIMFYIHGGSGVPHFHFRDLTRPPKDIKRGKADGALLMLEPAYCPHRKGNKNRLADRQMDEVIQFLQAEKSFSRFRGTNWSYLVLLWNDNNERSRVDPYLPMPDYGLLKDRP